MKQWFQRVVLARRWATFLVMGLSFVVFGAGSQPMTKRMKSKGRCRMAHGASEGQGSKFCEHARCCALQ